MTPWIYLEANVGIEVDKKDTHDFFTFSSSGPGPGDNNSLWEDGFFGEIQVDRSLSFHWRNKVKWQAEIVGEITTNLGLSCEVVGFLLKVTHPILPLFFPTLLWLFGINLWTVITCSLLYLYSSLHRLRHSLHTQLAMCGTKAKKRSPLYTNYSKW